MRDDKIKKTVEQVFENLQAVKDIGGSFYFEVDLNKDEWADDYDDEKVWTIRVSDHRTTCQNVTHLNDGRIISFVTSNEGKDNCYYSREYLIDFDGNVIEYPGLTIQRILNDELPF